jgi:hypothetical protein
MPGFEVVEVSGLEAVTGLNVLLGMFFLIMGGGKRASEGTATERRGLERSQNLLEMST